MKKFIIALLLAGILGGAAYYFRDRLFPPEKNHLVIATNTDATDISPYALNLNNATRIRNMYEGLVAFDRNLKIVPALAVSWGNLNDRTWEFRLRKGVRFHDGSDMTAQDVVDSFDKAMTVKNAQITGYINTIDEVSIGSGDRIIIKTKAPDPLLLSKLTKVFIHKDGNVGTGPYQFDEWVRGEHFRLKAFPDYWSQLALFPTVDYRVITSRSAREQAFNKGEIDLMVGLTEEMAMDLPEQQVITNYGLEVNFLMFQLNDPLFEDRATREAVRSLFDPDRIKEIGNHFVRPTNQFIARGVFGYNEAIPSYEYTPEDEAKNLFGNRLQPLELDYLSTYGVLVQYLSNQLRKAGFSVDPNALPPDALLDKISRNESQFFLMGWRSEDGDAGGFFDTFIHSEGSQNNGRYVNPEIDRLIEESRTEMDPRQRLTLLQEINAKVTEDLVGIPLFETSRLYALHEGVVWAPRLDGQVLAAEIGH